VTDEGAAGLRIEGVERVAAVCRSVTAPVIGIVKIDLPDSDIRITPRLSEVDELARAGAPIIAFDATDRPRPAPVAAMVARVHLHGALAMADVATEAEGHAAAASGADIVASTLSGYVGPGEPPNAPDVELVPMRSWSARRSRGRSTSPAGFSTPSKPEPEPGGPAMRPPLALACAAAIMALGQSAFAGDVTLLFWPGPESEAMQKVLDAYNSGPGKTDAVTVKQLLFSRQGYFDKELTDLAAGSKDFDLSLVTTYTLGRYAPYLAPIDTYVPAEAAKAFAPVSLNALTYDGKLYGVPTDISLHFLYYRQDLIDKLLSDASWKASYEEIAKAKLGKSLSPKDPADWTWDDYHAAALFFSKADNPDSPTRYGTSLQMKNLIFNIMLWQATLVSNGGNWLDAAGKPAIDSPAAKTGLELYKSLVDAKATPPGSIAYEYPETNEAFSSGQVATILQWNAAYNDLNDPKKSPVVAGKIGLAPMPAGSEGHKTHVHSLGIGLNKASEHQADAGKFLTWLATPAAMTVYGKAGGTPPMPAVLEALSTDRPEFKLVGEYAAKYGFVVDGGTAAYAVPVYTALAEAFSGYWAGQGTVEEALTKATNGMTKAMQQK
jgi:multiple sugar transport system substrate-binding protein